MKISDYKSANLDLGIHHLNLRKSTSQILHKMIKVLTATWWQYTLITGRDYRFFFFLIPTVMMKTHFPPIFVFSSKVIGIFKTIKAETARFIAQQIIIEHLLGIRHHSGY